MFKLENKILYIGGLYDIISNYTTLINDGENDVLYLGTNKFGSRILGSILYEDDEEFYLRYIHSLISEKEYFDFINSSISLKTIIEKSETVFIVDKNYSLEIINTALIKITDLPNDFIPLENSYCPTFVHNNSLEYTFSLQGELADLHKAKPISVSETTTKVFNLIQTATTFLSELGIESNIYSEVAKAGSFELNFEIELKEDYKLFINSDSDIKKYLFEFFQYLFRFLPDEPNDVLKKDIIDSERFLAIKNNLKIIYENRNAKLNDEASEQKVIDLLNYSVDTLKDWNYNGFSNIAIKNRIDDQDSIPIGMIDYNFYNNVIDKVYNIEIEKKDDVIIIDENSEKYTIQVYSINKETGKGGAYYNTDDKITKISFHLKGRSDYHNTDFTKSLDENKKINIFGIGKWVNGILKHITIEL